MSDEQERHEARRNWLKPETVADMLGGVSVSQVYAWIASGELCAFDASKKDAKRKDWRFRPEWVAAFNAKRTKNAEAA